MISKSIKTYLAAAGATLGFAIAGSFASSPAALAQNCQEMCPTVGQQICCPGSSQADFEHMGSQLTVVATTNGCFLVTSCIPPPPCTAQPWQVTLALQQFDGIAHDPNLGTIHWRNDPRRPASPATLRGIDKGQFPAYGTISFFAIAEIDGVPGVYRSREEVRLVNERVQSFNPFVNELYHREQGAPPISFINDQTGDEILLNDLTSLLN